LGSTTIAGAPSTYLQDVEQKSGFLSAALLLTGWRLTPPRAPVAGVMFALLTFKPQLGLVIPVQVVPAGCWRTLAPAVVTTR
jgi:hypothetical protein